MGFELVCEHAAGEQLLMPEGPKAGQGSAPDQVLVLAGGDREGTSNRFCLSRDRRLQSSTEFSRVLNQRINGRSKYFRYSLAPNTLAIPRMGLTVSRKVSGRAVERNRIRRQLKEYFRHHQELTRGYDLVVLCIPGNGKLSNKVIRDDLEKLWEKLEKHLSQQ
jgi:ribonuclease P protein component